MQQICTVYSRVAVGKKFPFPFPSHSHEISRGNSHGFLTWEFPWVFPRGNSHGFSHVGIPMGFSTWEFPYGKPMGIPTWKNPWEVPYGKTHGNSHMGKPMGIPTWKNHFPFPFPWENPFPRQPWCIAMVVYTRVSAISPTRRNVLLNYVIL